MKLIFIRHGETEKNSQGGMHQTNDPASLTANGVAQVKALIPKLRELKPEIIYTSAEARGWQTAEIISRELKVPFRVLADLNERNWGKWEVMSWPEIEQKLNQMAVAERYTFIPEGGESWQQMEARLQKVLKQVTTDKEECAILISHEGALRALMPVLTSSHFSEALKYKFQNAELFIFDYQEGKFKELKI